MGPVDTQIGRALPKEDPQKDKSIVSFLLSSIFWSSESLEDVYSLEVSRQCDPHTDKVFECLKGPKSDLTSTNRFITKSFWYNYAIKKFWYPNNCSVTKNYKK